MATTAYAVQLPAAMADDDAAIRAVLTQRAIAAGNVVAPDAEINVNVVHDATTGDRAVFADMPVTPMVTSRGGVLHDRRCRFIEDGLPVTPIPDHATTDQIATARRCGRCLPERPQT